MQDEWITTSEAADLLKISARQVRERIQQGKLNARRNGHKWQVHSSLSAEIAEVEEPPSGGQSEAVRRLEEQVRHLQEDKVYLQKELTRKDEQADQAKERSDTIILQLTRQLEQQQQLLEYRRAPFWKRWFRKQS